MTSPIDDFDLDDNDLALITEGVPTKTIAPSALNEIKQALSAIGFDDVESGFEDLGAVTVFGQRLSGTNNSAFRSTGQTILDAVRSAIKPS